MAATNRKRRVKSGAANDGISSSNNDEEVDKPRQKGGSLLGLASLGLISVLLLMWVANSSIGISPSKKVDSNAILNIESSLPITTTKSNTKDLPRPPKLGRRKIATAFLQPPGSSQLTKAEFPSIQSCSRLTQDFGTTVVNSFASLLPNKQTDPFLPWLHDFFLSADGSRVVFVGQNRRNCDTGKDRQDVMKFWEPQIALFQPIPVLRTTYRNGSSSFQLYSQGHDPHEAAQKKNQQSKNDAPNNNKDILSQEIVPETRFLCRFHWQGEHDNQQPMDATSSITLSEFPFNYEYVSWRKKKQMYSEIGRSEFWISQLMFYCPIPPEFQGGQLATANSEDKKKRQLLVDVTPIRVPSRPQVWLTPFMVGKKAFEHVRVTSSFFDITQKFDNSQMVPSIADAGRWANLPVCPSTQAPIPQITPTSSTDHQGKTKPYRLVLCTWTSASYHRRGEDEEQPLEDNSLRLREWLIFHRLVGFDHVVVYDNTPGLSSPEDSPLYALLQEFDSSFVTHQPWPAVICNNHRPGHKNQGDRSSQYAAEASCRERYGPLTDWLASIDTDEYLAPMKSSETQPTNSGEVEPLTWKPILDDMEKRNVAIMKFRSGRNYPRIHLMDPLENQQSCGNPVTERFLEDLKPDACLAPRRNETYLKVYNCDGIKRPRPDRFQRAMKQLYKPNYVLSHFVHYSTVTEFTAQYFDPVHNAVDYFAQSSPKFDLDKEVFVDELEEGTLIHARSVQPRETMFRKEICKLNYSRMNCFLGYECPDSVEWIDDITKEKGRKTKKKMNLHHDDKGNFCSCWVNDYVDKVWVPRLERELKKHMQSLR